MSGAKSSGDTYSSLCERLMGRVSWTCRRQRLSITRRRQSCQLRCSFVQAQSSHLWSRKGARNGAPLADISAGRVSLDRHAVDLNEAVNSASGRYRLDPDLVNSVIKAESGFNVRAVSPKGAQGLMQLMPGTASQLGVPNAFDPQANIEGGTKYLRELLERYNFDLVKALAAYNAGPQRVEQFGGSASLLRDAGLCGANRARTSIRRKRRSESRVPNRRTHRKRPAARSVTRRLSD